MQKKVVIFGGGTGLSALLKGLKEFPIDITAIVTVCDDGKSTGVLRNEFNIPAVGDLRRVLISLSKTEPLVEKLFNYRFETTSDLDGHALGNLLLTAMLNITGNMTDGLESLGKVLNLKGKVLPFTEDNITLVAKMKDGNIVEGENNITHYPSQIENVFYKEKPKIEKQVKNEIKKADLIIFSMGSLFTSIIPNLISQDIINSIDKSKAKLLYASNLMTQPGETDHFKASDHIKVLNSYLGNKKIDAVVLNTGKISKKIVKKYETLEQKNLVEVDIDNLKNMVKTIISNKYVTVEDEVLRHNVIKLSSDIFSYLI